MYYWSQRSSAVRTSAVYDTFWRFAYERQRIFKARASGASGPWTSDPVLARYRFTNVYRVCDRVSQYLIRNVIYSGSQSPEDVTLRVFVFKIFNKIETWEALKSAGIDVSHRRFSAASAASVLRDVISNGEPIYSAAYIMPPGPMLVASKRKYENHLAIIDGYRRNHVALALSKTTTMREAYQYLLGLPLLGSFLAFQLLIDLNYSEVIDFSESDFVVAGPGAKSGIVKCFPERNGLSFEDIIRLVAERQYVEFERRGLDFAGLDGRPLQLVDIQNVFCEVDKYARIMHPNVKGLGFRQRIKQRYVPKAGFISPWYPPKWNLNSKLEVGNEARVPR